MSENTKVFIKQAAIILLAGILVFAFVACKKKDKTDVNGPTPGSSVTSGTESGSSTPDDADEMTSSELEKLESEFVENVDPQITVKPSSPSSSDGSSSQGSSSSQGGASSDASSGGSSSDTGSNNESSKDLGDENWTGAY